MTCPFCHDERPPDLYGEPVDLEPGRVLWTAVCQRCGAQGPLGGSEKEALALWSARRPRNERTDRHRNDIRSQMMAAAEAGDEVACTTAALHEERQLFDALARGAVADVVAWLSGEDTEPDPSTPRNSAG